MNDPNAVPLDRIPVSTPNIPRFGGLPELPELPGDFTPLPPNRTLTSVTTVPFPSSPPKVIVELPKAAPKVTVEPSKPVVGKKSSTPVEPATSTAPQPRWVKEAVQDLFTPNRKKGLALTVAACLVVGAIALNAGFSGIGSPTRPSNSLVAATTPEKSTPPKPEEPTPKAEQVVPPKLWDMNLPTPAIPAPVVPNPLLVGNVVPPEPVVPISAQPTPQPLAANPFDWEKFYDRVFWKAGTWIGSSQLVWKGSSQLGMPDIMDPFAFGGQYAIAQPVINQATHSEPPAPPTPVPVVIPMPMITAPAVAVPEIKPLVSPTAPIIPEPVKIAEVTTPIVPKAAALISPNGQPSAFKDETPMPLTVAPVLPTPQPQPPALSLSGLTLPVPTSQPSTLQPIPQTAIRPVTNTEVRTAIDVDLHEPKRGDTYASISKMHYGDERYGAAIQAFNKGRNLGDGAAIELPQTQYLRQNYRQYIGGTPLPVSNDPARSTDWSPSAGRIAPTPRTFTANREGMTMWDVAEDVYGDRQKWHKIQDANPQLDANENYRIGDRFRLPLDAPQTVKRAQ